MNPVSRRSLLKAGGAVTLLNALPAPLRAAETSAVRPVFLNRIHIPATVRSERPMRILILGGRVFLGPALVKFALSRGHSITLLNRGISNPELFRDLPWVRADRLKSEQLKPLAGEMFDAVIDTWSGPAAAAAESARFFRGRADQYVYISTISVHDPEVWRTAAVVSETAGRRAVPADADPRDPNIDYAVRKRMAEDGVLEGFPDATVVRPHQILGFHIDAAAASQRYWPMRFAKGGEILLPGDGQDRVQYIDVGDLAAFIIRLAETRATGPYNAMRTQTWRQFADSLKAVSPPLTRLHWVDHRRLLAEGLRPAADLPLWVPRQLGPCFMGHDASRALGSGLRFREDAGLWRDIIAGTHALPGQNSESWATQAEKPLTAERERTILTKTGSPK